MLRPASPVVVGVGRGSDTAATLGNRKEVDVVVRETAIEATDPHEKSLTAQTERR